MSHTHMSNAFANSDESNHDVSLATITAGIVAAVLFLLISSYVANDANWSDTNLSTTTNRARVSTDLTGHVFNSNAVVSPVQVEPAPGEKVPTVKIQSQNDEAAHFSDALYGADFMSSFTEPT